jgi:ferredoxin
MKRLLKKEELRKMVVELKENHDVIAPVNEEELVLFRPVTKVEQILWDYPNSLKPIKEFFLPPREVLFQFKESKVQPVNLPSKKRVIWGVRPCDARSLLLLDKVFLDGTQDVYYSEKRKSTLLVGLSCNHPEKSCFCTSFACGPHNKEGMDLLITDLEEGIFFLESNSPEGEQLLKGRGKEVNEIDEKIRTKIKEKTERKIETKLKPNHFSEKLSNGFDSSYWEKASRQCISCGICRYLCATCHCFDIADEEGERVRFWDGCSFPNFTKMTSGENPRFGKKERFRQWYYHKFSYFKQNQGVFLCVGCGRCLRNCPVKIDFSEVLQQLPAQAQTPAQGG